jgi:hypothetical protein
MVLCVLGVVLEEGEDGGSGIVLVGDETDVGIDTVVVVVVAVVDVVVVRGGRGGGFDVECFSS